MSRSVIPDDLEELAQNSRVLLARAEGKVRVLPVPAEIATALSLAEGTIALCLLRVAFDIDDKPVEVMKAYYTLKNEYCSLVMRSTCRSLYECACSADAIYHRKIDIADIVRAMHSCIRS